MNIHQLSVTYVPEQDRILFRVNTLAHEEFKFWVTRRLALAMWPVVNEALLQLVTRHTAGAGKDKVSVVAPDVSTKKLLAEMKKEEELQTADFATPYDNQATSYPLGGEPLLVTEVNVKPMDSGQMQLSFQEALPGGPLPRGFQMALEQQMTHGMVALLQRALVQAKWIEPEESFSEKQAPGGMQDPDSESPKPDGKTRYMN